MMGLIVFIIALALAIAIAPIILGVLGTMLGLLATFLLWAFAGFPDNTPADTRPKAAVVAPADAGENPMEQLERWEREDRARHKARNAARRPALLDAQRRDHEARHEKP